jgi:hypothetical protein
MVLIIPFTADTRRILFPLVSEMNKLPAVSLHTAVGELTLDRVDAIPSPLNTADPVPTTVVS